ncbi:hypothetical protein BGW80DRAFT_1254139 [Lactifluus volemus]|nr:hypothetical protein BGW80DRAFT_1254139 [Lactifluus volemus]
MMMKVVGWWCKNWEFWHSGSWVGLAGQKARQWFSLLMDTRETFNFSHLEILFVFHERYQLRMGDDGALVVVGWGAICKFIGGIFNLPKCQVSGTRDDLSSLPMNVSPCIPRKASTKGGEDGRWWWERVQFANSWWHFQPVDVKWCVFFDLYFLGLGHVMAFIHHISG